MYDSNKIVTNPNIWNISKFLLNFVEVRNTILIKNQYLKFKYMLGSFRN